MFTLYTTIPLASLKRDLSTVFGVGALLAKPEANPKLAKNGKVGVMAAPLHLAPAKLSGYEVCPTATAGCRAACLHTAGNPVYMTGKSKARIARTRAYFEMRTLFLSILVLEIAALERKAHKAGMQAAIRLNATSDITWERVAFSAGGVEYANLMERFPNVEFYDYTKRANRRNLPANYTLTFSLAEGNDDDAFKALRNGHNVAVVFAVKRGAALPSWFHTHNNVFNVIDGDEHDFRPLDPKGVVVGLRAKGAAIGDTSGFVRAA
jgi:hypothetical protein